jgi:hypothetical protein
MNLRSPFWGLKVNKAGDAFADEKSQTLALEKPDLKSFSRLQEENLYVKVDPSPQLFLLTFPWSQRGLKFF